MREFKRLLPFDAVQVVERPFIFSGKPGWRWETVIPDYFNLWYVLQGRGKIRVDRAEYDVSAGSAFILSPGQRISAVHDEGHLIQNFAAHFHPVQQGKRVEDVFCLLQGRADVHDAGLFEMMARQSVRVARSGEPFGQILCSALIHTLVIQVLRSATLPPLDPVDQRIWEIIDSIGVSPERAVSVEELAKACGLSRVHFTRRFSKITGEPPSQYIIHRRIEKAGHLIRESGLKMEVISEMLGYSDVCFFSRQFKRVTGESPKSWKARKGAPRMSDGRHKEQS
jgi:AraC family transcriptional regulator of arabinose operon